ncbi:mitochondrial carrier [Neolentinus lepideus HHB14362 ss-1]|uniref:Mitochondrial carrier n=1 Tax=Neolentinus lepideus HHB14362 ss-1 TaxID=1314782 RepID=A0A165P1L7_9AGAM|nr:mitochondrial carrier [Neolentinus lepideus HHB14362 ss-1]
MVQLNNKPGPSNREIYEACLSGAQERPYIPRLRSDPPAYHPLSHSLLEFRQQEGAEERELWLRELWKRLPKRKLANVDEEAVSKAIPVLDNTSLTPERAKKLQEMYEDELVGTCNSNGLGLTRLHIGWKEFKRYAEQKEAELWTIFHDELDLDGNGHLDAAELEVALRRAGINLSSSTISEFMTSLTQSPHSRAISFQEFRNFLLLMSRKASPAEIYRFYEVKRFLGDDGRGAARVNMEGDVSLSAEDRPPPSYKAPDAVLVDHDNAPADSNDDDDHALEEYEEEHHSWLGGSTATKFLLAGGIAGAVSRTCTAPFDRLKIFLITRPPDLGGTSLSPEAPVRGVKAIGNAVSRIYAESGIRGFWIGNGLSVAKIFPESAIKFLVYETSKRFFAEYVDHVNDSRDISGVSRFLSGGMGGISSQLSIYPIETLKTQMMSSTGEQRRTLIGAARRVWQLGGLRAYYRGLTIGLVGVFPYSAIDMSTFEALKLAYLRSTGKDEPGVLATLSFGSVSGSVGATSVYPLNLVRTRLQASGSSGHPDRYTGILDVVTKTYQRDGWRGFYRGLLPTLAKASAIDSSLRCGLMTVQVVPAVSISYVVYEHTKRKLGV